MTTSRKLLAVTLVLVALAIVAGWFRYMEHDPLPAGSSTGVPEERTPVVEDSPPAPKATAVAPVAPPKAIASADATAAPVGNVPDTEASWSSLYDLHGSISPEDDAWLQDNGFPDVARLDVLSRTDDPTLAALAEDGDLVAKSLLAERRARAGGAGNEPVESLFDAAVEGSVYALKVLADIHLSVPEYRNLILAHAYNQVAAERGLFNALTTNMMIDGAMSPEDRFASGVFAMLVHDNLQQARIRRFGQPFPPNPRPGLATLWSEINAYHATKNQDNKKEGS